MVDENEENGSNGKLTFYSILVLLLVIAGYPAARMAVAYLDIFPAGDGREAWWSLWAIIFVGHWICAGFVAAAIAKEKGGWASIGLDWSAFIRLRFIFLLIVIAAVAAAIAAPSYYYGDSLPETMRSHPLGPVTSAQRLFWIAMAITAGIAEEILYRGYAITRLRRLAGWPVALLVSVASFALMHGPSAFISQFLLLYVVSGVIFGATFLLLGMRRLEILILIHIALDLAFVLAP